VRFGGKVDCAVVERAVTVHRNFSCTSHHPAAHARSSKVMEEQAVSGGGEGVCLSGDIVMSSQTLAPAAAAHRHHALRVTAPGVNQRQAAAVCLRDGSGIAADK
jgi:hypothetical protein